MSSPFIRRSRRAVIAATGFGLVVSPLATLPAHAAPDGSDVVIKEVYGGGGNSGATLTSDFVELFNPTDAPIDLTGLTLQYRSAAASTPTSSSNMAALTGTIPAKSHWLVKAADGAGGTTPLPAPDETTTIALGGTGGQVFLAESATGIDPKAPESAPLVVDLVGFGSSATTFEGTGPAAGASNSASVSRDAAGKDTDDNAADFTAGTPTPENSGVVAPPPPPPPAPETVTIAEIQGEGSESSLKDATVITRGVVTASYPTGGFRGFFMQTPGTGGDVDLDTHRASHGIFVYLGNADAATYPAIGDHLEVEGKVTEFNGQTQLTPVTGGVTDLAEDAAAPQPAAVFYPGDEAERESLEGMLLAPRGRYTVADNYSLNRYGEVGLARGGSPLRQPTDVARPMSEEAAAVTALNAARSVTLDDGATTSFFSTKDVPLPYVSPRTPVRVGAAVDFTRPVVLDYRFKEWRFQPTAHLTGANADEVQPATFANTRTAKPEPVGGDVKIASFNVLNYFIETGAAYEADGGSCSYYDDRDGNHVTVKSCNGEGPRGAADKVNLLRQQEKIVAAINALGADVVSLEEIENSAKFAGTNRRDDAVAALVTALNTDAGYRVWDFVASPAVRPALADEDVIRNAFIYKRAAVETVGSSKILTGSAAFTNAREPLAQVFRPKGGTLNQQFLVIVNHFKSKGSGVDDGTGQGNANPDRVAQAQALVTFAERVKQDSGTEQVFLTGDFNSYTREDPMQVLYDAGYTNIGATKTDESTYLFGGLVGSLDHILANKPAYRRVTGADVWNINSVEPVALEYSRYNYNATNLYAPDVYRASDHDPLVVGVDVPEADDDVMLNLLNINDFHGRIDSNTTKFATTIEQLRDAAGEDSTLFLSAGDNIGASLFASALAEDNPTIDVLNALDLVTSAVGNHEFDRGFADLTGHVADRADWDYLGANVYDVETGEPALDEYAIIPVQGLDVAVIGAVTQETPALVSPGGIEDVTFGDPVEAVNRVAEKLTDGDEANGEADVIVAEYHEGAGAGTPDGSTLAEEVAAGGAFADIVTGTSPEVDAIFTGHTHKQYAWDAPVPGSDRTRPVVQTGSYGANIGQITMVYDPATDVVTSYVARNVARAAAAELGYPRVAEVKQIVDAALAEAAVKGGVPVGEVSADITRAENEDRASESTLGNLVANSLRDSLSDPTRGGAEIGVANPGGLRADLLYTGVAGSDTNLDGVVTYAEANAVLPFVNNLWTLSLTGAQFKQVLEEQWQTNPDGSIPSRPFLHLGLSDNVSTTLDPSKPMGERVTSVMVDGQPLDLDREYRIGTFSFLAQGGDNFRTFADGSQVKDSGLIDREAWIEYLGANQPVAPQFDRRQVYATELPSALEAGTTASFTLDRLDLTSQGSPVNTEVAAVLRTADGDTALGTFPVENSSSAVTLTVPATAPAGSSVVLTATPSGTTVTIPVTAPTSTEPSKVTPGMKVVVKPGLVMKKGTTPRLRVTMTAPGKVVNGRVVVKRQGKILARGRLVEGKVVLRLKPFPKVGRKSVRVVYLGNAQFNQVAKVVTMRVVRR